MRLRVGGQAFGPETGPEQEAVGRDLIKGPRSHPPTAVEIGQTLRNSVSRFYL